MATTNTTKMTDADTAPARESERAARIDADIADGRLLPGAAVAELFRHTGRLFETMRADLQRDWARRSAPADPTQGGGHDDTTG